MSNPVYIEKNRQKKPAEDFSFLREKGIKHIEALSSDLWTDYNIHDPGITILESLCYAITDLSYRMGYRIEDILAEISFDGLDYKSDLFTAREILTCNPVTFEDFRKVIIDVEGVKNAWLNIVEAPYPSLYLDTQVSRLKFDRPFYLSAEALAQLAEIIPAHVRANLERISEYRYETKTAFLNRLNAVLAEHDFQQYQHIIVQHSALFRPINIRGLYDVVVELDDSVGQAEILQNVEQRLHACRNLCEDFKPPRLASTEHIFICTELDVAIDADAGRILAEVYYQIECFLAPSITFYTLTEMLDKGKTAQDIFSGPRLEHGFIDHEELQQSGLKTEIHVSDILQIIMDVEGVLAVKHLMLNAARPGNSDGEKWCLSIREAHVLSLDVHKSRVMIYKDGFPVAATNVEEYLTELRALERYSKLGQGEYDIAIPQGESKNIQQYHSIQNGFPQVYGLGTGEILQSDTARRKAQSKQLKAYLLFYDRILADFLAQLAHTKHLFSIAPRLAKTYFSQPLSNNGDELCSDISDVEGLFVGATDDWNRSSERDSRVENESTFNDRKNRFLNHLMARFGEQFTDYVALLYSMKDSDELISDKLNFLRACPEISYERGKSFHYKSYDVTGRVLNISGLEKRVARLLGIELNPSVRIESYIRHYFEVEEKLLSDGTVKFRFRLEQDGLSYFRVSAWFKSEQSAKAVMQSILRLGADESNYHARQTASGRFTYDLVDHAGAVLAKAAHSLKHANLRAEKIRKTVSFIQAMDDHAERFQLVEHILLRPNSKAGDLLHVSTEHGDDACPGLIDPYSFRLTVIVPYWPERFLNMDFRALFEQTIRREAPAHIHVKICWVDKIRMKHFESAWHPWLKAIAEHGLDDEYIMDKRNQLIRALAELRSIYPESTLHDCKNKQDNPVLLNRSVLGTIQEK